ncbi:hypothetical protein D039_2446B, partial [Vibrio parahaemolyticus EKP-028]
FQVAVIATHRCVILIVQPRNHGNNC